MNGGARGQVRRRRGHRLKAKGLNQLARGFLTDLVISYQFLTTSCVSGTRGLNLPSQSVLIETPGVRQHYPHVASGRTQTQNGWVTRLGPRSCWKGKALTQTHTLPGASPTPASGFSSTHQGLAVLIETTSESRSAPETLTAVTPWSFPGLQKARHTLVSCNPLSCINVAISKGECCQTREPATQTGILRSLSLWKETSCEERLTELCNLWVCSY